MTDKEKYLKLREKLLKRLDTSNVFDELKELIRNPGDDYMLKYVSLSLEDDAYISYPKNSQSDPWDSDQRYKVRFSKFLDKLMPKYKLKNTVRMMDEWSNILSKERLERSKVELLRGEDIGYFYRDLPDSLSSCMAGRPLSYFDIYADNDVELAVLVSDNKLLARGLIWHNVEFPGIDGTFSILSRVYALSNLEKAHLWDWAVSKGYLLPQNNTYDNEAWEDSEGKVYWRPLVKVKLRRPFYDMLWPYIDMLAFVHLKQDTLDSVILSTDHLVREELPSGYKFLGRAWRTDGYLEYSAEFSCYAPHNDDDDDYSWEPEDNYYEPEEVEV